jgi:hypothetical protein
MVGRSPPTRWLAAQELVEIGFERARVVMMNEAHNGLRRSVRTREVGREILPTAHAAGVRHLAMEALFSPFTEHANAERSLPDLPGGYLSQPEMRELVGAALEFGWTLIAYEADWDRRPEELEPTSMAATDWREGEQARNLAGALRTLPDNGRLLVWCGNHHLSTRASPEWVPMGVRFRELAGVDVFALDQLPAVRFEPDREPRGASWARAFPAELAARGGAAGFLAEEAPPEWGGPEWCGHWADAYLLVEDELV